MEHVRRYEMESMQNLRDLGGYRAEEGVTRFGVLFRSDLPWHLTEGDRARIAALGVGVSLDLRETEEAETMPDELRLLPGVEYRRVSMLGVQKAAVRDRPGGLSAFDHGFFWGAEYIRMLESNHPWARECVELLAEEERPVLFHCFTGKDRTGILAALVLELCGVPELDIAADYSVSQVYLRDLYVWMRRQLPDFQETELSFPFFSTDAANILTLTDHLRREYGGAAGFLRQCGAGEDTLAALRRRLIKRS